MYRSTAIMIFCIDIYVSLEKLLETSRLCHCEILWSDTVDL